MREASVLAALEALVEVAAPGVTLGDVSAVRVDPALNGRVRLEVEWIDRAGGRLEPTGTTREVRVFQPSSQAGLSSFRGVVGGGVPLPDAVPFVPSQRDGMGAE